jgi:tRNA nucleotidyltransferase (CCA-adding enzyme)
LSRREREAASVFSRVARQLHTPVYLVGGTVRDLLMGRTPRDLDLAVDGNAVALARACAREAGFAAGQPSRFLTIRAEAPDGLRVDLASLRRETYEHPGALPQVARGTLADDLARRDFTINAMAIRLDGRSAGSLVDPFGGERDLRRKRIRMIHSRSPWDDPTRCFRAVRFSCRLRFPIEAATRRWIREARSDGVFARVSGDRLRRELEALLDEIPGPRALRGLRAEGLLAVVAPGLSLAGAAPRLARLEVLIGRLGANESAARARFLALFGSLTPGRAETLAARLSLSGPAREALLRLVKTRSRLLRRLSHARRPSVVRRMLEDLDLETRTALAAFAGTAARRQILADARRLQRIRVAVTGRDLLAAGASPGPAIGRALQKTRAALLDGRVAPSGALAFALRQAGADGNPVR